MGRTYLVTAITGTIVGLIYLAVALGYPWGKMAQPGPGFYPFIVGILIVISAFGVGLEAKLRRLMIEAQWPKSMDRFRLLAVLISSLAYVLLLPYVGHPFSGTMLSLLVLHFMGLPRWPVRVGLAIGIGLGSYYIFSILLGVPLPVGIWFD